METTTGNSCFTSVLPVTAVAYTGVRGIKSISGHFPLLGLFLINPTDLHRESSRFLVYFHSCEDKVISIQASIVTRTAFTSKWIEIC